MDSVQKKNHPVVLIIRRFLYLVFQVDTLLPDGAELATLWHEHDEKSDAATTEQTKTWKK